MSAFSIDDVESSDQEYISEIPATPRVTSKKKDVKSLQELKVHYLIFCAKRDLNPSTPPEEQVGACDKDQRWLDSHVEQQRAALKQKRLLARGKTGFLRELLLKLKSIMTMDDENPAPSDVHLAVNNTKHIHTDVQSNPLVHSVQSGRESQLSLF